MGKVRVLLDSHQVPFSERYKALLQAHDVEVEDFDIPQNHPVSYQAYVRQLGESPAKSIHFLWGHHHWSALVIPRLLHKQVILQWIGSDVPLAIKHHHIPWRFLGTHITMDPQLSNELKTLHINAPVIRGIVPFPPLDPGWPDTPRALTYLRKDNPTLYSSGIIMWLAKQLPWAEFIVVGHDGEGMPPCPNVRYLGWVEKPVMDAALLQCRVSIRLTTHDGGGGSAMEALAQNRYVVWTKKYPFCNTVSLADRHDIKLTLWECLEMRAPNYGAREQVLQDFDHERIAQQLISLYKGEKP